MVFINYLRCTKHSSDGKKKKNNYLVDLKSIFAGPFRKGFKFTINMPYRLMAGMPTGERKQTQGQMDGWTLPNALSPCFIKATRSITQSCRDSQRYLHESNNLLLIECTVFNTDQCQIKYPLLSIDRHSIWSYSFEGKWKSTHLCKVKWVESHEKVPNVPSRCHTKIIKKKNLKIRCHINRRTGAAIRAHPSIGVTRDIRDLFE